MDPELQKKIDELETIREPMEIEQKVLELCRLADKAGDQDLLKKMSFELRLWMIASGADKKEPRFKPKGRGTNEKGENVLIGNPDDFPTEAFQYFETEMKSTKNPIRRARYADFLWEKQKDSSGKRNILAGQTAIDAYHECSNYYLAELKASKSKNEDYPYSIELVDSIARELSLTGQIGNSDKQKEALLAAIDILNNLIETKYGGILTRIADAVLTTNNFEKTIDLDVLKNLFEKECVYFEGQADRFELKIQFLKKLIDIAKLQKNDAEVKRLNIEIGETLIKAAEWKGSHYPSGKMVEAGMLENAFKHFSDIGENSRLDELKIKIKKAHQDAEPEYGVSSVPFEIKKDQIEAFFKAWAKSKPEITVEDYLNIMAVHPNMRFSLENAKKEAAKLKAEFPLQSIFPRKIIADNNTVFTTTSKEMQDELQICDQWNYFKAIVGAYLYHYFQYLFESLGLTADLLSKYLQEKEFLKQKKEIIQSAIKLWDAKDYLSFVHLIVPHLEDILRSLLVPLNEPTTSTRAGIFREIDLKDVLDNPKIIQILGEDLIFFLKLLLIDVRGTNLRNRVAHGIIQPSECNPANAALLLHVLIILGNFKTQKIDPPPQNPPEGEGV